MELYALAVYLPRDGHTIEAALDVVINNQLGGEVIAVTTSLKRIYIHLKSLETKQHLLKHGFYDPVAPKPLVVTAQGIPVELSAKDVTSIFASWGEVIKVRATTKQYRNIRYRNGNWQIQFKRLYKKLPVHISATHRAIEETIRITAAFDNAEMLKLITPTRSQQPKHPQPPPQPQRNGEKTSNLYQKPTQSDTKIPQIDGATDMEVEQTPTQVNRKRNENDQEIPKHPKKTKTETIQPQESIAQSAAHQTSNPEVPVRDPSETQTEKVSKHHGESSKPNKYMKLTNKNSNSAMNKFSSYVKRRIHLFLSEDYKIENHWSLALEPNKRYGSILWAFFLTDIEWGALMFCLHGMREEKSGNKDYRDTNYDIFYDSYMNYCETGEHKNFADHDETLKINMIVWTAQERFREFQGTETFPKNFYPSEDIWAIWRMNGDLFFK